MYTHIKYKNHKKYKKTQDMKYGTYIKYKIESCNV